MCGPRVFPRTGRSRGFPPSDLFPGDGDEDEEPGMRMRDKGEHSGGNSRLRISISPVTTARCLSQCKGVQKELGVLQYFHECCFGLCFGFYAGLDAY